MALLCFVEKNCSMKLFQDLCGNQAEEYLNENKIDDCLCNKGNMGENGLEMYNTMK